MTRQILPRMLLSVDELEGRMLLSGSPFPVPLGPVIAGVGHGAPMSPAGIIIDHGPSLPGLSPSGGPLFPGLPAGGGTGATPPSTPAFLGDGAGGKPDAGATPAGPSGASTPATPTTDTTSSEPPADGYAVDKQGNATETTTKNGEKTVIYVRADRRYMKITVYKFDECTQKWVMKDQWMWKEKNGLWPRTDNPANADKDPPPNAPGEGHPAFPTPPPPAPSGSSAK